MQFDWSDCLLKPISVRGPHLALRESHLPQSSFKLHFKQKTYRLLLDDTRLARWNEPSETYTHGS